MLSFSSLQTIFITQTNNHSDRWWAMLVVAVQNAVASTLMDDAPHLLHGWEGDGPPLGELLHGEAPAPSRLPLR